MPPSIQPPQAEPCTLQVPAGGERQGAGPLLLQEPLLSCVPHRYAQEVSRLCLLSAGTYRVVPSTYWPDAEGSFTVTIATRVDRRSIHSQEMLGQVLQEVRAAPACSPQQPCIPVPEAPPSCLTQWPLLP